VSCYAQLRPSWEAYQTIREVQTGSPCARSLAFITSHEGLQGYQLRKIEEREKSKITFLPLETLAKTGTARLSS